MDLKTQPHLILNLKHRLSYRLETCGGAAPAAAPGQAAGDRRRLSDTGFKAFASGV